ncbi:hypothetical protein C1N58_22195 (plasmid) [Pantoea sp. SGAir0180]
MIQANTLLRLDSMLVQTKDISVNDITVKWVQEEITRSNLPEGDAIRIDLLDLQSYNFKSPVKIIHHLTQIAKNRDGGPNDLQPLINIAKRIVGACDLIDDEQDINSPFITGFKYNSVTSEMDKVRVPVGQVMYFSRKIVTIPNRMYKTGNAHMILNDHNETEFTLIQSKSSDTPDYLLDCYIKSAEHVFAAWIKR